MRAPLLAGVLLVGCSLDSGLRSESANALHPWPADRVLSTTAWVDRSQLPRPLRLSPGRRIATSDWVPNAGGVLVTSDVSSRFSRQAVYLVSPTGTITRIAPPATLDSPINEVVLLALQPAQLVFAEAYSSGASLSPSLLKTFRGLPDHGDILVTDLSSRLRRRYRSGHYVLPSPNSEWLAFWRSGSNGLHNLFVASAPDGDPVFVCAVTEADRGSGLSFATTWSSDSLFLRVHGAGYRWSVIDWVYEPARAKLYAMPPNPSLQRTPPG